MPFAEQNARGVKHGILAALRQYLYLRALGQDAPLPDSCPALHAEACFDAGCPIATRVGLLKVRITCMDTVDFACCSCKNKQGIWSSIGRCNGSSLGLLQKVCSCRQHDHTSTP